MKQDKVLNNIIKILETGDFTTGQVLDALKEKKPVISSHKGKNGRAYTYGRRKGFYAPTMNQLGNLMRRVADKTEVCNLTKQQRWTLKEEYKNAMDRKIQAQ
tara:strand:+ start:192 stop:497 length:306 start_codon:yes stop_codon:yes gene_type:complete